MSFGLELHTRAQYTRLKGFYLCTSPVEPKFILRLRRRWRRRKKKNDNNINSRHRKTLRRWMMVIGVVQYLPSQPRRHMQ